jgi:hypothetical protein
LPAGKDGQGKRHYSEDQFHSSHGDNFSYWPAAQFLASSNLRPLRQTP